MRQESDVREQGIAIVSRLARSLQINGALVVLGGLLCGFIAFAKGDSSDSLSFRAWTAIVFLLGGAGGGAWMIRKGASLMAASAEMKTRMDDANNARSRGGGE